MDFRLHNRNFHVNFDQDWRNNVPLPSFLPETNINIPRNIFPIAFSRLSQNPRQPFYVRNQRIRPRRRLNLNEMRNSLRRFRHEMYEAYGDLEDARDDFQETKSRLQDAKHEVIESKNNLQNAIMRLDRTMNDFNSPGIFNTLTMRERNSFQQDIDDVRQDIEEAKTRMQEVEHDLSGNDRARLQQSVNMPNPLVTGVKRSRSDDNSVLDLNGNTTNTDNNDKFPDGSSCCSVCMENPVNSVLYSCGHMCICYVCASKLLRRRGDNPRCPMCRAVIKDVIKIYRS